MKKIIHKVYVNRFWHTGDIEIWQGDKLLESVYVNYSASVEGDFLVVYEATGGHDNIHRGAIERKIYIGDAEYQKMEFRPLSSGGYECGRDYYDENFKLIEKRSL